MTVAMIGNPTADKGHGSKVSERVFDLLSEAGLQYGFTVIDLTGDSYDDSLANARAHADLYDALVVVGGDGMIALGANAVGGRDVPLGIVAVGSGNDFARGLDLPVNRVETAVHGIVGALVQGSFINVDMGYVTVPCEPSSMVGETTSDTETNGVSGADDGCVADGVSGMSHGGGTRHANDLNEANGISSTSSVSDTSNESSERSASSTNSVSNTNSAHSADALNKVNDGDMAERRCFAGMLSCGLDARINDRANHSHFPNGTLRYLSAVIVELTQLKPFGYHVRATLANGDVDERDIVSPLLTVANSRHIGGGIEVSPYSLFDDGLLDLVWIDHMPSLGELAKAVPNIYNGRLLASDLFGWERVRDVEITRISEGTEPPTLMADGEYIGHLPVRVGVVGRALRVLVPPAVARDHMDMMREHVRAALARDGRTEMGIA